MRRIETTYEGDTIGQRLAKFAALMGACFAITAAVIVTQRLSDDALGVIVGLLLAGVPLLAIVALLVFILVRRDSRPAQPQPYSIPPIVLQMPQPPQQNALPDYGMPWNVPQRQKQRAWDIVGGDDD
jgi:hypothetical protein